MPSTPKDTRPRVSLAGKVIDLAQLADEVGAPLCASDTEVVVAEPGSPVTAKQLTAALAAHVPAPTPDAFAQLRAAPDLPAFKAALIDFLSDARP